MTVEYYDCRDFVCITPIPTVSSQSTVFYSTTLHFRIIIYFSTGNAIEQPLTLITIFAFETARIFKSLVVPSHNELNFTFAVRADR